MLLGRVSPRVLGLGMGLGLALSQASTPALAQGPTKEVCIAANETAQDLRQTGKLRQAREKLLVCVAESCPGAIRDDCMQRLSDVNAALPTLVFEAKDPGGNDLGAVSVAMDGQRLVDKLDGAALAVDPGQHRFTFDRTDAAGHAELTVVVREGDKGRHVSVVIGAGSTAAAGSVGPVGPVGSNGSPSGSSAPSGRAGTGETSAPQEAPGGSRRTIGLVLGGAGVVGLVVGSIFGVMSKSTYDNALQNECGGQMNGCSPQGAQDGQTAHGQATVSTVGFVAGGVLLAAGAVLYLTAPRAQAVGLGASMGPGTAALSLRTSW